jgi:D-lactate dehydrogenase (cytochrome)
LAVSRSVSSASRASDALIASLRQAVGDAHVRDDDATRALFSQDIFAIAQTPVLAVVSPSDTEQLAAVVALAAREGLALAPRGGGLSYTKGYIPTTANTLSLDLTRLDKVLRVDADDMTVTVQAGCTWKTLNDTLKPLGLRTPFWGPMSGLLSTIGGGLSQQNAFFGAGHHGTTSESVVALTMVLADGRVLRTGARGEGGDRPFWRHYGPDLTGLFCGDCGALGIKAEITLRLIQTPPHEAYASFAFDSAPAILAAMTAMVRAGVASELCGFDPNLTKVRLRRASLATDVGVLKDVVAKSGWLKGAVAAVKIALAGRNFVGVDDYPLHVICEGRSKAGVADDLAEAKRIALAAGGREIENSIPRIIRAQPFPAANSILGPGGERWATLQCVAPLSKAAAIFTEIEAVHADLAPAYAEHGIDTAFMLTSLSTNAFIIEPTFYWPGARHALHEALIEPAHLARLPALTNDPAAFAVVAEARNRVMAIFQTHGTGHLQIGRVYPYRASRDEASWALLETIKRFVDPAGHINPGVLGLNTETGL